MAKVQAGTIPDKQLKGFNASTTKTSINAATSVPELRTQVAYLTDIINSLLIEIQEIKSRVEIP